MKILLVSYVYGNRLVGGAETFMTGLTRALAKHGHQIEVATTTTARLEAPSAFGIHWHKGFPEGVTEEEGIPIHRFDAKNRDGLQRLVSKLLLRRVLKDLNGRTYLETSPEPWIQFLIERAQQRPSIYQALYQFCRGPASPKLIHFLNTHARDYDALLATMVPFNTPLYAVTAAKRANRPVGIIPLFHHLDWYHHWSHFYDVFKAADHLFVLNDYSVGLFKSMGCRATRLGVGFDPDDFPSDPGETALFRSRFHLPREGTMLLFVGRKVQSKRYDLAIDTMKQLRSVGHDVFLVMIGPEEDRSPITGAENGVYYLRRLSRRDLLVAYQASDILLEPTEFESFGITFCEAWMYEKPVIGNRRCPAVASLIRHGVDGFLGSTPEEFKTYVLNLLQDPNTGREMGRRGKQKVLSEYNWGRMVEIIETSFTNRARKP